MRNDIHELRIDLAAALRWAARLDLHEGICNHFSVAVTPEGDRFLINPQGFHWAELKASDLVLADAEGKVLEGGNTVEQSAFFIHSRIHMSNPKARWVLHTHMPYATALTLLEGGRLEPIEQNALRFHGRIAYDDDYGGLAHGGDEGARIAAAMDGREIAFLGSHGIVVSGPTIARAFDDMYYLERACRLQVLARSTGLPLRRLPAEVVERTARQFREEVGQAEPHFVALKRILDRQEPEYRG